MTESLTARASRLQCALELKNEKQRCHYSENGVNEAKNAFDRLTSALKENVATIVANNQKLASYT